VKKAIDYQLESACKDRLAEPHLGFPRKIFAVLDGRDHHVVLTLCFKLVWYKRKKMFGKKMLGKNFWGRRN